MVEHIYQSGVSGIPIVVKRSRRINDTKVNVTRLRSLGNSQVAKVAQLAISRFYLDDRFPTATGVITAALFPHLQW